MILSGLSMGLAEICYIEDEGALVEYELSEGDRDFIARQLAASRRRKLQAFKASSVSATIAAVAAGVPGLAALWYIGDSTLAAGAAAPGMMAAVYVFRRMHPDFAR